jgi:hypothetical protein
LKTPEEIVALLAQHIGLLYYHRPLMYGGTGEGVELTLINYHQIWSEVVERYDEFRETWWKVGQEEDCGACGFSTRYALNHPKASEEEIAQYVCAQWRKISDRLGVPIAHAALKKEFYELRRQNDELNRQSEKSVGRKKKAAAGSTKGKQSTPSKKQASKRKAARKRRI